ncbi:MAG TPA: hypothetical protein VI230_08470 [Ignavibacteriaceae bacterium]
MKKLYYFIKPAIPRRFQILLRRKLIQRQRQACKNVWPILDESSAVPENWAGWPDGKKFGLIITHDVELQGGHDKCRELYQLEKELGFVSSFNFVPERYRVSPSLRTELRSNGFEVGVHGLKHDGKLFQSKTIFDKRSAKINSYLKEWGSTGFRAPAMHHNLEWIHELNIEYDLSTFDTDPFEPQSDGMGTIFPIWISRMGGKGYWELPYTLAQDFTLFILMEEKSPAIWIKKLDWIAKHEGMALVNVHPDYINFSGTDLGPEEFPVNYYRDFLMHIKERYKGEYYNALPGQLVQYLNVVVLDSTKQRNQHK